MQRKLIPGLSLAVIKDGATVIEKSYGFANLEHGVPATSDGEFVPGVVQDFRSHKLLNFAGVYVGFTTCMTRFVEDGLTVIILTNQDAKPWELCREMAGLVDPALV